MHNHGGISARLLNMADDTAGGGSPRAQGARTLHIVATLACKAPFKQNVGGISKADLMRGMLRMGHKSAVTCEAGGGALRARHAYGMFVVLRGAAEAVLHVCAAAAGMLQCNTRYNTFQGMPDAKKVPFLCTVDIVGATTNEHDLRHVDDYDLRLGDDEHEELVYGGALKKQSLLLHTARDDQLRELAAVVEYVPHDDPRHALAQLVGKQLLAVPSVYDGPAVDDGDNGFAGPPPRWTTAHPALMHTWIRAKPQRGTPEWDTMLADREKPRVDRRKWLNSTRSPKQTILRAATLSKPHEHLTRVMATAWCSFVRIAADVVTQPYKFTTTMVQRWTQYAPRVDDSGGVHDSANLTELRPRVHTPVPTKKAVKRQHTQDIAQHFAAATNKDARRSNDAPRPAARWPAGGKSAIIASHAATQRQRKGAKRGTARRARCTLPPPRAAPPSKTSAPLNPTDDTQAAGALHRLMGELGIPRPGAGSSSSGASSSSSSAAAAAASSGVSRGANHYVSQKAFRGDAHGDAQDNDQDAQDSDQDARDSPSVAHAEGRALEATEATGESASPVSSGDATDPATPPGTPRVPEGAPEGVPAADAAASATASDADFAPKLKPGVHNSGVCDVGDEAGGYSANEAQHSLSTDFVPPQPCPSNTVHVTRRVIRGLFAHVTDIVLGLMRGLRLKDAVTQALVCVPGSGVRLDTPWCIHDRDFGAWDRVMHALEPYINVTTLVAVSADASQDETTFPWKLVVLEGELHGVADATLTSVTHEAYRAERRLSYAKQKQTVGNVFKVMQSAIVDSLQALE